MDDNALRRNGPCLPPRIRPFDGTWGGRELSLVRRGQAVPASRSPTEGPW